MTFDFAKVAARTAQFDAVDRLGPWAREHYVIAGTGSRELANASDAEKHRIFDLLLEVLTDFQRCPHLRVLSGGAEGWDHALTVAATQLGIPYALALPNTGYGDYYWRRHSVTGRDRAADFATMLAGAELVEYTTEQMLLEPHAITSWRGEHMNLERNTRMVNLASFFVVYDPSSPGTRHCFQRIKNVMIPFEIIE